MSAIFTECFHISTNNVRSVESFSSLNLLISIYLVTPHHLIMQAAFQRDPGKHSNLRFANLSDDELRAKKRKLIPANTERANKKADKMLNDYIKERAQAGLDKGIQFENLDRNELNALLSRFYMDARRVKGDIQTFFK